MNQNRSIMKAQEKNMINKNKYKNKIIINNIKIYKKIMIAKYFISLTLINLIIKVK